MSTYTQTSQLVVFREGHLDEEWLQTQLKIERSEALQNAGRELLRLSQEKALQTLKWGAHGLLNGVETFIQSAS